MTNTAKDFLMVLKSATGPLKAASKRAIEKTAEAAGDLIGNKSTHKITNTSKANTTSE